LHDEGFRGIGCGMDGRAWIARHGFWPLALLWLPAGVAAQAMLRFGPPAIGSGDAGEAMAAFASLALAVPCGLPLALGCRRLRRLGYRRGAWLAGIVLGVVTVCATVIAGLLGPAAIAVGAAVLSLPVWIAWLWLARHG